LGFFENTEAAHILELLSPRLRSCIKCDKIGLGNILGDFFTNLFGHPVSNVHEVMHTMHFKFYSCHALTTKTVPGGIANPILAQDLLM
jgi:hypothetical protein